MNVCFTISFRMIRDIMLYNGWTEDEKRFHKMQRRNRCHNGTIKPNKNLSVNSKSYPTPLPLSQAGWLYTALPGLSKYQKIAYDLDKKEPIKKHYTMKCCLIRTIHYKTSSLQPWEPLYLSPSVEGYLSNGGIFCSNESVPWIKVRNTKGEPCLLLLTQT